ncbi:P-loop containing nucleoside triphosphate hydrolase protein [Trametes elegans]|nr:P-loop containing nucleoside triphosphate hydrolase protein [Trametes elegans]
MDAVAVLQTVMTAIQNGAINQTTVGGAASGNATAADATIPSALAISPWQLPSLIYTLLSFSAVRDWLKLLLLGAVVEACRRLVSRAYYDLVDYFWITATFDGNDTCHEWIMHWLSHQPAFRTARTLDVNTRVKTRRSGHSHPNRANRDGPQYAFVPSLSTTYTVWYKRRYMTVTRDEVLDGPYSDMRQTVRFRILTRNHDILRSLISEAKALYDKSSEDMISIHVSDGDYWKRVATLHRRPMNSIILDPGMADLVLNDARDFLASRSWYAERGIPHRRGYLLYGAPGTGKTSLIHSIAGELKLDVYILSLTRIGLDDTSLSSIIGDLPTECIVLVEDIDAAFTQGVKRDIADPEKDKEGREGRRSADPSPPMGRVTLSGLLNALDGIAAQEGRILFATTNDYEGLDPALCRPGRLDLHLEFKLASKYQCRELFRRFYLPSKPETETENKDKTDEKEGADAVDDTDENDSGYGSRAPSTEDVPAASEPASSAPASASSSSAGSSQLSAAGAEEDDRAKAYVGTAHMARAPRISRKKAAELADRFAAAVPHRAFSMATLQGYLMAYKTRPLDAVRDLPAWVEGKQREKEKRAQAKAKAGASESKPQGAAAAAAVAAEPAADADAEPAA